jgi:pimeloyl-ACP methyl ester carboxylesterase
MRPKRSFLSAFATLIVAATAQPQRPVDAPHSADQFAVVHGLKLQYVDWGGRGDVVLFLTGLGASAHQFDAFAPRFTANFHVLGLTRRGQGLSDKPPAGYDTATLAEDINGFLDVMRLQPVNLIAHSIGGMEMTRFAVVHPSRAAKLVYLDAANGPEGLQLMADAGIPYPPYHSDAERQINTSQSTPDFASVKAPVLAFFVVPDSGYAAQSDAVLCPGCSPNVAANVKRFWQLMEEKNFWNMQIDRFRSEAKQARVVVLHGTNHMFFADPNQTDAVVKTIQDFLLER